MSSFFTQPASQKKRKRQDDKADSHAKRRGISSSKVRPSNPTTVRQRDRSDSISGSDSDGDRPAGSVGYESDNSAGEDRNETAAEKRLRLAEQYLENIRQEVDEVGFDAADIDRDLIAERLKEDVAESKGKLYRHIAQGLDFQHASRTYFRADQMHITALASCPPYVYTVAKDMSVVKWELPESQVDLPSSNGIPLRNPNLTAARRPKKVAFSRGRRSHNRAYLGHTSQILCAAASSTGLFLATGGLDRRLVIWDVSTPSSLKPVKVFTHHRDAVTGLAFRRGTNQLYSSSRDRTVKVWSLDELAYVETLFGHQDSVVGIASASREVCVSVGARDRTARLWKVGEEAQLVFRGGGIPGKGKRGEAKRPSMNCRANGMHHDKSEEAQARHAEGSIDTIAMVDDETFVTGADNGSISLWSIHKKKPVAVVPLAHGLDPPIPLEDTFAETNLDSRKPPAPPGARWITALATIPYSDVVLSGSWDGTIRAWKVSEDKRELRAISAVGQVAANLPVENGTAHTNGATAGSSKELHGVIVDIAASETGDRGKDGVCIVAGLSTELRLGRWKRFAKRSTAVVLDVSHKKLDLSSKDVDQIEQA